MKTSEETKNEFLKDLQSLLNKYNATLECKDYWQGYPDCGEDVRMMIDIQPTFTEDGTVIQEYTEIDLGCYMCYEDK